MGAAIACGACLLAFRHGQLSAARKDCNCGHVPTNSLQLREEEEAESTPASEQKVLSCMLETAGLRGVLRRRLHVGLRTHVKFRSLMKRFYPRRGNGT